MTEEQFNRPDFKNRAHQRMAPAQEIVRDVKAGTLALRAKSSGAATSRAARDGSLNPYLPKFPAEHDRKYAIRRNTATLFNAYGRTVQGLVGMIFKKNPVLSPDVLEIIRGRAEELDDAGGVKTAKAEGHVENIDLAGTHLDVFCREAVEDAFEGHSFVLVDMQKALAPGATLEDERRAGLRPYWVRYKAGQAFNFRPAKINGRLEIGQITFEEETSEPAGPYGEREVKQYRTFMLVEYADAESRRARHAVRFELKKKVKNEKGEETFETIDEGEIRGFDRIPVAVVYGKKTGFLESQPPLLDLALLNISYFQKKSDRDNNLHLCGSPTPVFSGVPEDWDMLVSGSGFGIKLPGGAEAKYLEPEGVALEESRLDLQELRGEMAALGLSTLEGRPQVKATATETVIDFTQESSELETIARSAQDAFELCLQFHAKYLGLKSGGSLSLGSHLKSMRLTAQQIQVYIQMAAANGLTWETVWSIMERGDALPDTFNAKTEADRLKKQRKALSDELMRDFNRGGGEENDDNPPGDE